MHAAAGCIACADWTLGGSWAYCSLHFRGGFEGAPVECVCGAYEQEAGWDGKAAGEGEIDQVAEHAKTTVKDAEGQAVVICRQPCIMHNVGH
jgi:hypothetical protein